MSDRSDGFRAVYDLPEVRGLLSGAGSAYSAVRATVREVLNGALASRMAKRFHDHASERGMIYYLYSHDGGASGDESAEVPADHFSWAWTIEDSEGTARIWYEKPDRWREEVDRRGSAGTVYDVADGGQRWIYAPPDPVLYTSDNYAARRKLPPLLGLLDPSVLVDRLDPVLMRVTDRRAAYAGRKTLEVEARTISLDHIRHTVSRVWTAPTTTCCRSTRSLG